MPLTRIKSLGITDGTIALADLSATGTASSTTFLRGDNSWGAAGAAPGQVIQIVHTTFTGTASTTSQTPADISGFSASITPSSASNKVLVFVNVHMGSGPSGAYGYLLLLRGSTSLVVGTTGTGSQINTFISSGDITSDTHELIMKHGSNSYLDSPATTSATTYKLQFAKGSNGTNFYINRVQATDNASYIQYPVSSLTLMEIKG